MSEPLCKWVSPLNFYGHLETNKKDEMTAKTKPNKTFFALLPRGISKRYNSQRTNPQQQMENLTCNSNWGTPWNTDKNEESYW